MFNVQKQPLLMCGGAFMAQKCHLDSRTESYQDGRKSSGSVSTSSTYPTKKGQHEG